MRPAERIDRDTRRRRPATLAGTASLRRASPRRPSGGILRGIDRRQLARQRLTGGGVRTPIASGGADDPHARAEDDDAGEKKKCLTLCGGRHGANVAAHPHYYVICLPRVGANHRGVPRPTTADYL